MLKQSQKRTKRAALSEALMSSTPASTPAGWRRCRPSGRPGARSRRRCCCAYCSCTSKKLAVVHHRADDVVHVVGLVGVVGDDRRPAPRRRAVDRVAAVGTSGGVVHVVRRAGSSAAARIWRRHSASLGAAKCATPLVALWIVAPPSSSKVTSSCVTVLTTFGPGDEHVARALDHEDEVGDGRASRPRRPRTAPGSPRSAGSRRWRACCAGRCRRSRPG